MYAQGIISWPVISLNFVVDSDIPSIFFATIAPQAEVTIKVSYELLPCRASSAYFLQKESFLKIFPNRHSFFKILLHLYGESRSLLFEMLSHQYEKSHSSFSF